MVQASGGRTVGLTRAFALGGAFFGAALIGLAASATIPWPGYVGGGVAVVLGLAALAWRGGPRAAGTLEQQRPTAAEQVSLGGELVAIDARALSLEALTVAEAATLARLDQLQSLSLVGATLETEITDAVLPLLEGMESLKRLSIEL